MKEKRKNLKLIQERQKEEDLQFLEEQKKMDIRKEQQREYLLNKIKNKFNVAYSQEAENQVRKIQTDQEEEDKKMIHYMNEKCRIADEKEMNEKIKREKEKRIKEILRYASRRKKKRRRIRKGLRWGTSKNLEKGL